MLIYLREAAKKALFLSGLATKRGGGVRAGPLRKNTFLKLIFDTKLEGGGALKPLFLRLPLLTYLL